ncbi:MAG: hypothetical protein M3Z36_06020 [Acidobacteriota bacterium]|nr:hypothetical protein [Acidobacteriota bacterium]
MRLAATLLPALPLFAQVGVPFLPPPSSLKDIFNLTPDQVQKTSALYADYNSFASEKNARMNELNRDLSNQFRQPALDPVRIGRQQRIADVQIEIRVETAKERPDPMALGVRYVELQLLSNDLQYQANQVRQRARTALTGDQAARLKALDDLAASAQALNLLLRCNLLVAPTGSQYAAFGVIVYDAIPNDPNPRACRVF